MSASVGHDASRSFVLTNVQVLTVDAGDLGTHGAGTVLRGGTITVTDGAITAIEPANRRIGSRSSGSSGSSGSDASSRLADRGSTAGDVRVSVIDGGGGIVLPGLVNAHAHLPMTLLRGVADDRDLQAFLARVLPLEAAILSERTVRAGTRLAIAESLLAGCTAALDMYFWPLAELDEADTAGFRLQTGPTFIGFDGPDRLPFADRLRWAERHLDSWPGRRWVMPHSTYTLSPDELRATLDLARAFHARVHVHAAENQAEVDEVIARHGRRPVELLDDLGGLGPDVTLAHAVALTDDEIARIAATGTSVAHCPVSNLKTAAGFCRVPELLAAGVPVGLGTDGTATSNDLDPFLAMRTAAIAHKGHRGDAALLPAAQVLHLATIGAARAAGIDDLVGSIELGKRADLVLLDGDSLSLTPAYDPVSAAVYAAGRGDVRHVWVDGRRVVRDRELTTIDRAALLAELRHVTADVARAL